MGDCRMPEHVQLLIATFLGASLPAVAQEAMTGPQINSFVLGEHAAQPQLYDGAEIHSFSFTRRPFFTADAGSVVPDERGRSAVVVGLSGQDGSGELALRTDIWEQNGEEGLRVSLPEGANSPSVAASLVLPDDRVQVLGNAVFGHHEEAGILFHPKIWIVAPDGSIVVQSPANGENFAEARAMTAEGDILLQRRQIRFEKEGATEGAEEAPIQDVPQIQSAEGWSQFTPFISDSSFNQAWGAIRVGDRLVILGSSSNKPAAMVLALADGAPLGSWILGEVPGELRAGAETEDGLVVVGWSHREGQDVRDALVMELDKNMTINWMRLCGGLSDDLAMSVTSLANGNILVGAGTLSGRADGPREGAVQAIVPDPWILELDPEGYIVGETTIELGQDLGTVVGIAPISDGKVRVSTRRGSIFDVETLEGNRTAIDWSGENAWTRPLLGSGTMVPGAFDSMREGSFDGTVPALTCVDPTNPKNDGSIDLLNYDAAFVATSIRDRRWPPSQEIIDTIPAP